MENQSDEKIIDELKLIRDLSGYEVLDKIYLITDIDNKEIFLNEYIRRTEDIIVKISSSSEIDYCADDVLPYDVKYKSLSEISLSQKIEVTDDEIDYFVNTQDTDSLLEEGMNFEVCKKMKVKILQKNDNNRIYTLLLNKAKIELEKMKKESATKVEVENKPNYNLEWNTDTAKNGASQRDFMQLVDALFSSGVVLGNKKNLILGLTELFQFPIISPNQQSNNAKNTYKNSFLDRLAIEYKNYVDKADEN